MPDLTYPLSLVARIVGDVEVDPKPWRAEDFGFKSGDRLVFTTGEDGRTYVHVVSAPEA